MTDPTLYVSMLLSLMGIYTLIASFDDDDNGGDGEKIMYNLDLVKASN